MISMAQFTYHCFLEILQKYRIILILLLFGIIITTDGRTYDVFVFRYNITSKGRRIYEILEEKNWSIFTVHGVVCL